jgi:hypothetical protein
MDGGRRCEYETWDTWSKGDENSSQSASSSSSSGGSSEYLLKAAAIISVLAALLGLSVCIYHGYSYGENVLYKEYCCEYIMHLLQAFMLYHSRISSFESTGRQLAVPPPTFAPVPADAYGA